MKRILDILKLIPVFVVVLLETSVIWCMRTWQHLKMDELIYELSAPLRGTGEDMIRKYIIYCLIPAVCITIVLILLNKFRTDYHRTALYVICAAFVVLLFVFAVRLDLISYLRNMNEDSEFISENYVSAKDTELIFPERKRNLIYIFLESVEATYTDISYGGAFEEGCIPELTELALENECFSDDKKLNGGIVYPGTTWTMGGMFAQTSGLPLKIDIGENLMSTQRNFFPQINSLGDILAGEGYEQELLLGSDVEFGGRKVYFDNHGKYTIHDYPYMLNNGILPEGYNVWWGFEDEKLFDIARKDLLELAASDKPFNMTMLTVDTHFEDGYVCRLCKNEHGNNQYANVMACSSRQVTEFVKWVQEQEFYDDTTIVICGDHTTMDSDFCNEVPADYIRKTYTAIVNPAVEKERNDEIQYSTMDMFPTTLAALGVHINGNRLGLGTNLFSTEPTLTEKYGREYVEDQLKKKSSLMNELSGVDYSDEGVMKMEGRIPDADVNVVSYDPSGGWIKVDVEDIINVPEVSKVYMILSTENGKPIRKVQMKFKDDRGYEGVINLKGLSNNRGIIEVIAVGANGKETIGTLSGDLTLQAHDNILDYVNLLRDRNDVAILISSKLESMGETSGEVFPALRELGISLPLSPSVYDMQSFYAVIDGENVTEDMDQVIVSGNGILKGDGSGYSILSISWPDAKIVIDEQDYSPNKPGLNFVVYDYASHRVIDAVNFNVNPDRSPQPICMVSAEVSGGKAKLVLSKVYNADETDRCTARGELWDPSHPDKVNCFDFIYDDGNFYADNVDISGINDKDCYMDIYMCNDKSRVEKKVVKWHGNLNLLTKNLDEYINKVKKDDSRLLFISSKDTELSKFGNEINDMIDNKEAENVCFVAVNGEIYVETDDSDAIIEKRINNVNCRLESRGAENSHYGEYSAIEINNKDYSLNESGLNAVVYNCVTNEIEDRVVFRNNDTAYRFYYYDTPLDLAKFYYYSTDNLDVYFQP